MVRKYWSAIRALIFAAAGIAALAIQVGAAPPAPTRRGLWVGGDKFISEFQGKALKKSGTPNPRIAFGSTAFYNPSTMAFDAHNNLWIGFFGTLKGSDPILEVSRADIRVLASGGAVKPAVILRSQGTSVDPFVTPASLAFDAAGNLWVADLNRKGILEFTPQQIARSGAPVANIFIDTGTFIPFRMRFDASDNLWVTLFQQSPFLTQIWRFAEGDRASSGLASPGLMVNIPGPLLARDLAFDAAGNMWTAGASAGNEVLEMFSAADLSGAGEVSPSPAVSITSFAFGSSFGDSCFGGIDFDPSGDLWVSMGGANSGCDVKTQVVEFTPSQLSSGGNLDPALVLGQNRKKRNLDVPGPMRFGPKP
jgi:hypothetical protein